MSDHVDILNIAGVDHSMFYNSGEDINLVRDDERKPYARVFRKGGKTVYRSGEVILWDDATQHD